MYSNSSNYFTGDNYGDFLDNHRRGMLYMEVGGMHSHVMLLAGH